MATTPRKPEPKSSHDERDDKPDAREEAQAPPAATIADEQRARSAEMAAMGVDAWKAAHDERTEEEKAGNRQVPGVVPQGNPEVRSSPEAKSWEGSSRTTQAARHAQNPAASR